MKKILLTALVLAGFSATAQVKVGDNATAPMSSGALLEMESTSKGLLISRMTTAQRTAIASPANGLQVFDTDTKSFWFFDATALPAPGVWVEGSSKGNEEWAYNGTDAAIQAKRALANSKEISIFDTTGSTYKNLSGFDWSTEMTPNGIDNFFIANPKGIGTNTVFNSNGNFPTATPLYSSSNGQSYYFNMNYNLLKEPHVASIIGGGAPSLSYIGNRNHLYADAVTTNFVGTIMAEYNYAVTKNTTTANISGLYGQQNIADHWGTGTIGAITGGYAYGRVLGSGSGTNITGFIATATTASTAGNTTTMIGLTSSATHNATAGTMTNLRGLSNATSIVAGATIPQNSYGFVSSITNSSASTSPAGSVGMYGATMGLTNNQAAKFTYMTNLSLSNTSVAASGATANHRGIVNNVANNSTSTDATTSNYGYESSVSHNAYGNVTNVYGTSINTSTGTTVDIGIPSNFVGVSTATNLRTLKAGTSSVFYGISNRTANSSAVSPTYYYGYNGTVSQTGAGFSPNLRGMYSSVINNSTGTGTSTIHGLSNYITNSSTTVTGNVTGIMSSVTNTGKSAAFIGVNSSYTNTSTQGNTFNNYGLYNVQTTTSASNDNYGTNVGIYSVNTFSSTGKVDNFWGATISAINNSTGANNQVTQRGIYVDNTFNASVANLSTLYGGYIYNNINTAVTGTVDNVYGLRVQNRNAGTGSIGNYYGLFIDNITTGVTGNKYAIYYSGDVPSSFGGTLRLSGSVTESTGVNHLTGGAYLNMGTTRSGAKVYLGRGLKADSANANTYISSAAVDISRVAVELTNGVISFIGQAATENVAVDGAIVAPVEIMRINATTQNVGIGATSPDRKLVVDGEIGLKYTTNASYNGIRRNGIVTEYFAQVTGTPANVIHRFVGMGDVELMNITQGGNVGIGTTTPKTKLHVTGLPVYLDNATAKAALGGPGVAEGAFFHQGDGIVRVVF